MTRIDARQLATQWANDSGLDEDAADAAVSRVMEIFHEEFTKQEWRNFVDQEISRHANP